MAGEVAAKLKAWGDPLNLRDPALGINRSEDGFGSSLGGRSSVNCQMLFADGSVQTLATDIDPVVLKALSTPSGDDPVGEFWTCRRQTILLPSPTGVTCCSFAERAVLRRRDTKQERPL